MLPLLRLSKRFVNFGWQRRNIFCGCAVRFHKASLSLNRSNISLENARSLSSSVHLFNYPKRLETQFNRGETHSNVLDELLFKMDGDVRKQGRISLKQVQHVIGKMKVIGSISSNQCLLILRCCGSILPEVQVEDRTALANSIWETAKELGCQMDISHYNTLLNVYLENEHKFDPIEFLSLLESNNVPPNRVTYQRLIQRYCQDGNIDGASKILEFMKEKQLPLTEAIFNDLIMGHAKSNNMEDARNILEVMRNSELIPASKTYCSLARGYAMNGDIEAVLSTLEEAEAQDATLSDREHFSIIYTLAVNNYGDYIDQILPKMEKRHGFNLDCLNLILELVNKGHHKVGYSLLTNMIRGSLSDGSVAPSGTFFVKQLVRLSMPPELIVEYCEKLQSSALSDIALLKATECALELMKGDHALHFLKILHAERQPIRQHYFWPIMISKKESEAELFAVLNVMKELNCPADTETFSDYLFPYISLDDPIAVANRLKDEGHNIDDVINSLVWNLLLRSDVKTALVLVEKFLTPILAHKPNDIIGLLARVFTEAEVSDVSSTLKLLDHALMCRPSESNENEYWKDPYGKFLRTCLNSKKLNVDQLKPFLLHLKEKHIVLSQFFSKIILTVLEERNVSEDVRQLFQSIIITSTGSNFEIAQKTWELSIDELKMSLSTLQPESVTKRETLKRLLVSYCREWDLKNAEAVLDELKQIGLSLSASHMAMLLNLYSCQGKLEEANHYKETLDTEYPNFYLDDEKIINLASALAKEKKLTEMTNLLSQRFDNYTPKENLIIRNLEPSVARLLCAVAEEGDPERTHALLEYFVKAGICKKTPRLLGSIILSYLFKGDVTGAVEELKKIAEEHNSVPATAKLCMKLIELEDTDKLQTVMELVSKFRGETFAMFELASYFVELGRMKQARKILTTPGLRAAPEKIGRICGSYLNLGKIEALENFIEISKDVYGIDREQMFCFLIKGYVKNENVDKALSTWLQMQEENMCASEETLYLLGNFLKRMNKTPPFVVPEKPLEGRKLANSKSIHQERDTASDVSERYRMEVTQEMNKSNWLGAVQKVLQWNEETVYRHKTLIMKLGYRLAETGEVKAIEQLQEKLSPESPIHLNNQLGEAYIKSGQGKTFLASLQNDVSKYETYFPEKAFMLLLDSYPEEQKQISDTIENIYKEKNFAKIRNMVWAFYMKSKQFDKANAVLESTPELNDHIILRPLTIFSREYNDEVVSEKVFQVVQGMNVDNRGKGIAASNHVNVLVSNNKLDEAVEFISNVLKSLEPNHLNRLSIIRLGKQLLAAGKSVPFVQDLVTKELEDIRTEQ